MLACAHFHDWCSDRPNACIDVSKETAATCCCRSPWCEIYSLTMDRQSLGAILPACCCWPGPQVDQTKDRSVLDQTKNSWRVTVSLIRHIPLQLPPPRLSSLADFNPRSHHGYMTLLKSRRRPLSKEYNQGVFNLLGRLGTRQQITGPEASRCWVDRTFYILESSWNDRVFGFAAPFKGKALVRVTKQVRSKEYQEKTVQGRRCWSVTVTIVYVVERLCLAEKMPRIPGGIPGVSFPYRILWKSRYKGATISLSGGGGWKSCFQQIIFSPDV